MLGVNKASNPYMKLFLDTEFTALKQDARLISLALVSEEGRYFYAEFTDFDRDTLSDWHKEHVLAHLLLDENTSFDWPTHGTTLKGDYKIIKEALTTWLSQWTAIEIWADVPAYDWVFFCELFGGALHIPSQIHFIVRDLATFFHLKGIDANISRFDFAYNKEGSELKLPQHNALADAWTCMRCYQQLTLI